MALIGTNTQVSLNTSDDKLHDEVWKATYKVFKTGGAWYVQIDTYGRQGRQSVDQPSQKVQLELSQLKKLMKSMLKEMKEQGMDEESMGEFRCLFDE